MSLSVLTVVPRSRTELSNGEVIYHQPDFLISKHRPIRELYLPPAKEVCEGYVFTGVCLSTGGVYQPHSPGRHTPPPLVDTPPCRHPDRPCWDTVNKRAECILVTARKRSLGQGNIFTPVCHSVHRGACVVVGGCAWLWGACMVVGGVHGCGGHVWLWGACMVAGGACVVVGGCAWLWGACMVVGGCACLGGCIGYDKIRSMSGRFASYWNAFLLGLQSECYSVLTSSSCWVIISTGIAPVMIWVIMMRSNNTCCLLLPFLLSFIAHRTLNAQEADNRHDEDDDAEITLLLVRSTTG